MGKKRGFQERFNSSALLPDAAHNTWKGVIMRGSPRNQAHVLGDMIKEFGSSKHEAKQSARAEGASNWAEIAKNLGLHSYATADAYRDVWTQFFEYSRAEFGVRDSEKITPDIVKSFLDQKIDQDVAHATFMQYASALTKLENALNKWVEVRGTGNKYDFRGAISESRVEAHKELVRFSGTRAYEKPDELVRAIEKSDHQLAGRIQHESGARIHETSLIRGDQLKGMGRDTVRGVDRGYIQIQGKGGKIYKVSVSKETYQKLADHIKENKEFRFEKDQYRDSIKSASIKTDQRYNGSHGLRWNFAQTRFDQCREHGLTYEQALGQVSHEMGHEREDITEHYLR